MDSVAYQRLIVVAAIVVAASGLVPAQGPRPPLLHEWTSLQPTVYVGFGSSYTGIGDVDGDGATDVVVGAPLTTVKGIVNAGRVYLFSGSTGALIRSIDGSTTEEFVGGRVSALGDVDRDGSADFLVSAQERPTPQQLAILVRVLSGRTTRVLHTFRNFYYGTDIGDVDRDGWSDFLLRSTDRAPGGVQDAGQVDLMSGRDFSLIRRFVGSLQYEGLGDGRRAGDLDADGHADVLLVSQGSWPNTGANGSWAYSGRTGRLLHRFAPLRGGDTYGQRTSGVGDVDADGHDDVGVSDNGSRVSSNFGAIDVFSGRTGALLFTLTVPSWAPGPHISGIAAAGDVDGDGFGDVLWGARGWFWIHSGRDQRMLAEMAMPGARAGGGWPDGIGDVNDDDFPDVCVGPFLCRPPCILRVYSGAPVGVSTVGVGCPDQDGTIPRIGATGRPLLGATIELHASRVHTGQTAVLLLGFSDTQWGALTLPFDLAPLGMGGCLLRTSVELLLPTTTTGTIPEKGHATFPVTIPSDLRLRGVDLYAQWLLFGRGAPGRIGSTTRALKAAIF